MILRQYCLPDLFLDRPAGCVQPAGHFIHYLELEHQFFVFWTVGNLSGLCPQPNAK